MIITRLVYYSGMGNQMFMYSAGLALATRLNTELKLGAWELDRLAPKNRPYQLKCFPNITELNASFSEMWSICPREALVNFMLPISLRYGKVIGLIRKLVSKVFTARGLCIYPSSLCSPEFFTIPDNTYIVGYWESEKFFENIKPLVRTKFQFPDEYFRSQYASKIRSCNSVALHVRRGDKNMSTEIYYKHALEKISALTEDPEIFVFSDDMNWCKANLPKIYDAKYNFVENQTPPQDMALMTICKHVIVSGMSTFSWWGAWLNNNPRKIIIVPDIHYWFPEANDRHDFFPDDWLKVD